MKGQSHGVSFHFKEPMVHSQHWWDQTGIHWQLLFLNYKPETEYALNNDSRQLSLHCLYSLVNQTNWLI